MGDGHDLRTLTLSRSFDLTGYEAIAIPPNGLPGDLQKAKRVGMMKEHPVKAFTIPAPLIDPTALPPPISTGEPGSFARYTLQGRVPAIVQETIALNCFPADVRGALEALRAELTGGMIRELREEALDRAFWNTVSAPFIGRSWLDAPWYWAEAYFYRRLLEATGYFQSGPTQGVDPFNAKKRTELTPDAAPRAVNTLLQNAPDDPRHRFESLLHASLWGNRIDLSYEAASRLGRAAGIRVERANLLVDDTPLVWEFLRTGPSRRLAVLADNAGTELLMDLVLVDYLLETGMVSKIDLHLKPQPFFVSDAMPQDVADALEALEAGGGLGRSLAQRLRVQRSQGRLHLTTHWHYATSLFFFQLPEDLRSVLARMDLVVIKGDANYRRLLGDAHWPPTTPFARVAGYFPAPLLALRTLKAEIIVGLDVGEAERLQAQDPAWLVNGQRGVIQSRL